MPAIGIGALFAGISIATIASTAMMIGTVLSVVGMVTKNKLLSQIGMGLGLAGGLTSLAGAAGLFDSAATLGSVFGGSPATGFEGMSVGGPSGIAGDVAAAGGGVAAPPTSLPGADLATQQFTQAQPVQPTAPSGMVESAAPPTPTAQQAPVAEEAPLAGTAETAGLPSPKYTMDSTGWGDKPAGSGWWDSLSADAKAKFVGSTISGGAQLAGGMMQGYLSGMTASQKLEFDKMVNAQQQAQKATTAGLIQFQPKPATV